MGAPRRELTDEALEKIRQKKLKDRRQTIEHTYLKAVERIKQDTLLTPEEREKQLVKRKAKYEASLASEPPSFKPENLINRVEAKREYFRKYGEAVTDMRKAYLAENDHKIERRFAAQRMREAVKAYELALEREITAEQERVRKFKEMLKEEVVE
jgi:hypothetical protein